jgi:excisionase family DNA binding protein
MEHLLVGKREAAEALSISVRGVERLIAEGTLPAVRVRGSVRIPVAALRSIAAATEPGETAPAFVACLPICSPQLHAEGPLADAKRKSDCT